MLNRCALALKRLIARILNQPYETGLGRVRTRVKVKEGEDSLLLYVDRDPMRLTAGLTQARERMKAITENSTDEEKKEAALLFAGVIFGKEQAQKLLEFYHGDADCVFSVCGRYFRDRLRKLIIKAQKKAK